MFSTVLKVNFINVRDDYRRMTEGIELPEKYRTNYVFSEVADPDVLKSADCVFFEIKESWEEVCSLFEALMEAGGGVKPSIVIIAENEERSSLLEQAVNAREDTSLGLISDVWDGAMDPVEFKYRAYKWLMRTHSYEETMNDNRIYKSILNTTDDLIWVKDKYGIHRGFNNAFLEALPPAKDGHKKTYEECEGKGHLFLWELSPEDYEEGEFICMESEYDVMNSRRAMVFDETLLVGEGDLRKLKTTKVPIFSKNGEEVLGTFGSARHVN